MSHRYWACFLVVFVPSLGHPAEPRPQDLVPGARVRITAPSVAPGRLGGTVRTLADDAIELAIGGREELFPVPRGAVLRLEVSEGRNRGKGALIGGGALAAVGAIVGAVGCRDSDDFGSGFCGAVLGGAGLVIGGGVGALVGAGDRWKDLPSDRVQVSLTPVAGRGAGLSIRLRF